MGWSYTMGATKSQVIEDITRRREEPVRYGVSVVRETLAKCLRGNVLYYVQRVTANIAGKEPYVLTFLGVSLLGNPRVRGRAGDGWGSKDMEESMGPTEAKCPPSYFDLVGPPPNEWAANWREKCRVHAARMARKPVVGDTWTLPTCTPSLLTIASAKPLRGKTEYGTTYRVSKGQLGERVWSPSWATATVVSLLQRIHYQSEWDICPILADALQDAGCEDESVLATLRTPDTEKLITLVGNMRRGHWGAREPAYHRVTA